MQKLPEIYKNRSRLLRKCLDLGLQASTILELVQPMEGKTEEEKESIAANIIEEIDRKV